MKKTFILVALCLCIIGSINAQNSFQDARTKAAQRAKTMTK